MRIKRLVSAGLLAAMVTMSVGTVAQAYNNNTYYGEYQFSDFAEPQVTSYENKDTRTSISIGYIFGYSQYDTRMNFEVMGASDNNGSGAQDVSDKWSYVMTPGESRGDIYNYVNEWGYNYAAIRISTMGDRAVSMGMNFRLDN